jgi:hypothetical protein
MTLRRAFYSVLFPAAVVLPAWLLVGSTIFGGGGWETLGVMLGSIVLFLVMGAISGVIYARASVRQSKAVSWLDAAIQTALYASVIALGFNTAASTALLVALIIIAIAGFWVSAWQLFTETRRRVRDVFAAYENPQTQAPGFAGPSPLGARNDGEYIVIETSRDARS